MIINFVQLFSLRSQKAFDIFCALIVCQFEFFAALLPAMLTETQECCGGAYFYKQKSTEYFQIILVVVTMTTISAAGCHLEVQQYSDASMLAAMLYKNMRTHITLVFEVVNFSLLSSLQREKVIYFSPPASYLKVE